VFICWVWLLYVGLYIWKAINRTCFEKKFVNNPNEIIFSACSLMRYRVGLYPEHSQQVISKGVELMIRTAIKLLGEQSKKRRLLLTDGRISSDDSEDQGVVPRCRVCWRKLMVKLVFVVLLVLSWCFFPHVLVASFLRVVIGLCVSWL
jgi:hypothetical protein